MKILTDFLKNRKQRVTVGGQTSSWTELDAGVPLGSILGSLLFLIYINDLPDGLSSNDTFLFSMVHNVRGSAGDLNKDLKFMNEWAFQWKMRFNPDPISKLRRLSFQGGNPRTCATLH